MNLTGEHVGYCDFSVLPMAIDLDMLCAVKVTKASDTIVLSNDDVKFDRRKLMCPPIEHLFRFTHQFSTGQTTLNAA